MLSKEEVDALHRQHIKDCIDRASPKDWTKDFPLENGMYYNHCVECDSHFTGYKRRIVCRECDSKYVHLRCHECKATVAVPYDLDLLAYVNCWYCNRSKFRMHWIELPDSSR